MTDDNWDNPDPDYVHTDYSQPRDDNGRFVKPQQNPTRGIADNPGVKLNTSGCACTPRSYVNGHDHRKGLNPTSEASTPGAYRKRPVVIEAVQITDDTFDAPHPNPAHIVGVVYDPLQRCAFIDTLEGRMRADMGDWIIRGVKGELYPCKPDIFAATYEPVTSTPGAEPGRCGCVDDDERCEKPRGVAEHRPCGNIYNDGGPGFCGTISCHQFQPAAPAAPAVNRCEDCHGDHDSGNCKPAPADDTFLDIAAEARQRTAPAVGSAAEGGTVKALLQEWASSSHHEPISQFEERCARTEAFLTAVGSAAGEIVMHRWTKLHGGSDQWALCPGDNCSWLLNVNVEHRVYVPKEKP